MFKESNLVKKSAERKDVAISPSLINELFEFAKSQPNAEELFSNYAFGEGEVVEIKLPDNFGHLIKEYPGKYFLVAYEDRKSSYFQEGTRIRRVLLSTKSCRFESDLPLREIEFKEEDQINGGGMFLTVKESINNKSFNEINNKDDQAAMPHGEMKCKYSLNSKGKKKLIGLKASRLDEGMFKIKGKEKPVRLNRKLEISKGLEGKIEYNDGYIIGRSKDHSSELHADVKTTIIGSLDSPKSVLVEVGYGNPETAEVIYEDPKGNVKVLSYEGFGVAEYQLEIIKEDPSYAAIFQKKVIPEEVINTLKSKVIMLRDEWNDSESIFSKSNKLEENSKAIE